MVGAPLPGCSRCPARWCSPTRPGRYPSCDTSVVKASCPSASCPSASCPSAERQRAGVHSYSGARSSVRQACDGRRSCSHSSGRVSIGWCRSTTPGWWTGASPCHCTPSSLQYKHKQCRAVSGIQCTRGVHVCEPCFHLPQQSAPIGPDCPQSLKLPSWPVTPRTQSSGIIWQFCVCDAATSQTARRRTVRIIVIGRVVGAGASGWTLSVRRPFLDEV